MSMKWFSLGSIALGALLFGTVTADVAAQNSLPTVTQPTGGQVTTLTVQGGNRSLFKIALPQWRGDADAGKQGVEVASRDFVLSSMFQVLDPQSFTANLTAEGATIDPTSWRNVGAEGVIKGEGPTQAMLDSRDPYVRQFLHAEPDGPVPFHMPARRLADELGLPC